MIANYHTHTPLCRHAQGAEEEYVENAIARELQILGFSDHTPHWFPGDYCSRIRMFPEQLTNYCQTVRNLQKKYSKQIEIPLGMEVEYYPATWQTLLSRLQDAGVEYMLLGQHWNGNEFDAPHNFKPTEDTDQLIQYCNQVITAMETGKFTYCAHPDYIYFTGDRKTYETNMRRICMASLDTDTPLEINFAGLRGERHYPNPLFWSLAAEEGCKVVLGIDAHDPSHISDENTERAAMDMVNTLCLNLQHTVPLKSI